jgi:MFS family permease
VSERTGRKPLIIVAGITFTVGAILAAAAPTTAVLIIARFVIGLAVGSAALVVPLYLSEIAPTEIRGACPSLNQLMIVLGILLAFIVNAIFASSGDWRLMLGLAAVPSIALLIGTFFVPETPRFLVRRGRSKEAHEVLEEVRSEDVGADEDPKSRVREIKEADEREEKVGLRALSAPWLRPALIVAIGLAAFQQFIGINTIIYYAPTTLTNAGFGSSAAIYANLVIGTLNVVATVVAIRLVDRLGRKPLLLGGLVGMGASLAILGVSSAVLSQPDVGERPRGDHHAAVPRRLHRLLRGDVGSGGVGDAARGPAAERPRRGHGRRRVHELGGELRRVADLPRHAQQLGPGPGVPGLCRDHRDLLRLRREARARDEGAQPGGDRARAAAEGRQGRRGPPGGRRASTGRRAEPSTR